MIRQGEEQSQWDDMFSRGIDPDVSDPTQCHSHPEAPQQWPHKEKVIQYTLQVSKLLNNKAR